MKTNSLTIFLFLGIFLLLSSCFKKAELPWEYTVYNLAQDKELSIQKIQSTQQGIFALGGNRFESGNLFHFSGQDWIEITLPQHRNKAFYSLDENQSTSKLTLVGYDGNILIKEDNSSDWYYYDQPYWEWMQDLAITPNGTWIVSGEAFHNGKLFHIHDTEGIALKDTFDFELSSIDFKHFPHGYALGYGTILETIDAGQTWTELSLEGDHFKDYFHSSNAMYIIGYEGTIWKKTTSENIWKKIRKQSTIASSNIRLRSIHMINDDEGFIVADNGLILHTKNQWKNIKTYKIPNFNNVDFLTIASKDASTLWIGCSNGNIIEIYL